MNPEKKKTTLIIINAVITAAMLFLCIKLLSNVVYDRETYIFLGIVYYTLALMTVIRSGLKLAESRKKAAIYYILMAVVFAVVATLALIFGSTTTIVLLALITYYFYLIMERILYIAKSVIKLRKRRKRRVMRIAWNVLFILILLYVSLSVIFLDTEGVAKAGGDADFLLNFTRISAITIPIILQCLGNTIALSFYRIKLDVLKKIIQKTFAAEILFGLVMLIIAFSFILQLVDPAFMDASYGDALWYCFAIVTTIGFGDFAATSAIGRILSVILGIYGIIVVALITSIIVNFYSEIKTDPEPDDDDSEAESDSV